MNAKTTPVVTVDSLLSEACAAGQTMLAKSKEAAKLAAAELDPSIKNVADRVKKVVEAHATAYSGNHNVKAIFSDALWLLAVPAAIVESQIKGEKTPKQFKAADSLDLPKHAMKDAAKQVREQNGAARAPGGGAKAKAATPAPVAVNTFFDDLAVKIKDAGEFAKIVAVLELAGYVVTKRGAKQQGAKQVTQKATATLAEQLAGVKKASAAATA